VDTADHEAAALTGNQCRGKGLAVSVSDMLICAVARSRGWAIFSTDPDFSRYAKVLPIKLHDIRH
jgi:predicted nucleic acid-binding protein